jgi:hypothetical protein
MMHMADGNCNERSAELLYWLCQQDGHPRDNLASLSEIVGFVSDAIMDMPDNAFHSQHRSGAARILRAVADCIRWQSERVDPCSGGAT